MTLFAGADLQIQRSTTNTKRKYKFTNIQKNQNKKQIQNICELLLWCRPPDPTLHDPCWRAARARTVEEKPKWEISNNKYKYQKKTPKTYIYKKKIQIWIENWRRQRNSLFHLTNLNVNTFRIYKWEERVGIEREHNNLSKSSPDLSRFYCRLIFLKLPGPWIITDL